MPIYRPMVTVYVAGTPTEAIEVRTHEGLNEVGSCSVVLALPADAHVEPNAVVEVTGTMTNVATGATESARIFQGQTRGPTRDELSSAGALKTLHAQGWLALMDLPHHEDVAFTGPISARDVVMGLFADRAFGLPGRPSYHVDEILTPDDEVVMLGGNADFDAGQVRIPAGPGNSYFKWIAEMCDLFGYAVYENAGVPKVSRVFGSPTGTPARAFAEADKTFRWEGAVDLHGVITWWEAWGPTIRDADGQDTTIRSFPASVPPSDDIPDPPSVTRDDVRSDLLVTQELADAARNVREIEYGVRRQEVSFTANGAPTVRPGQVLTVEAPTVGVDGDIWCYTVSHDWGAREGYTTSVTGSFGGGEPLPAGSDVCATQDLLTGPVHLGDEFVAWYAVPNPTSGLSLTVGFTPIDDYTSISITGRAHGTNSQFVDGVNADLTVSRFQIWQDGEEIGEGALPVLDENYAMQLDYTDDANWSDISIPIPGTLVGGVAAELRILAGANPALPPDTDDDDFELKDLVLTNCAPGSPTLPGEPVSPTIPPAQPSPPDCALTGAGGSVSFGVDVEVMAGPWVWPAGYRYLRITGTASGLSGEVFGGSSSVQAFNFTTAGGRHPLIVPGTWDGTQQGGTWRVGGGTFEVWHDLGSTAGQTITGDVDAMTNDGTSTPPPFSVSGTCWTFTNDPG